METKKLEEILRVNFQDKKLLNQALIHRSYLNENQKMDLGSNERLEFLGDTVLSLTVSNFLYHKFKELPEGDLTNLRAALVKTKTLAAVAQDLGLGDFILLSRGEEEGGGRKNPGILADTFEAVTGAIFLDGGIDEATKFITAFLLPLLPEIIQSKAFKDFKSLLQEKMQADKKISPLYRVIKAAGPDHSKIFTIGVFLGEEKIGTGKGHSKQEAEQGAAQEALENLGYLK